MGDAELRRRRGLAQRFSVRALASARVRPIDVVDGASAGYLRLPLRTSAPLDAAGERLLTRHGAARSYPAALDSLTPFRERVLNSSDDFAGARVLAERLLTFPTHSLVRPVDVAALDSWLAS